MWRRSFVLLGGVSDPYRVLGVPQNATAAQIKAVYRRLSKKYHPDVIGGDGEAFKKINAAYVAVRDGKGPPQARAQPRYYRPQQANSTAYQAKDFSFTRRGPNSATPFRFSRRYYSGHHRQSNSYNPPKDMSVEAIEQLVIALGVVWLAASFFTAMTRGTDITKEFFPGYLLTALDMNTPIMRQAHADFTRRQAEQERRDKEAHVVKA